MVIYGAQLLILKCPNSPWLEASASELIPILSVKLLHFLEYRRITSWHAVKFYKTPLKMTQSPRLFGVIAPWLKALSSVRQAALSFARICMTRGSHVMFSYHILKRHKDVSHTGKTWDSFRLLVEFNMWIISKY